MNAGLWILADDTTGTFVICDGPHVGLARYRTLTDALAWVARANRYRLALCA